MNKYNIIREEIISGSLEDFRALMHEIRELQHHFDDDNLFLQGERTPSDYPENMGRWEITLGGTLLNRGFILARQLPNGTTKLQFGSISKYQPIGLRFDKEYIDYIMKQVDPVKFDTNILIVTVTRVESRAVIDVIHHANGYNAKPTLINDRIYHDLGIVNGRKLFMVQSEMGSGSIGASLQTVQKGIAALSPAMVIMVGIAFGVNSEDQSIGDVLVSHQLMLYELQRIGTDEGKLKIIPRGDRPHASSSLINLCRSAHVYWDESTAKVHFGLILSGEKLVDNIDFREQLREFEPEAIGGEMEAAGLYAACQDAKIDWILIKAICDWADGLKGQNKGERQALAAKNAASFMLRAIECLSEAEVNQQGLVASTQSASPQLTLKLIDHMKQFTDEIAFTQTVNRQDFSFGLALENLVEGSDTAEKIEIRIECSWDGNEISYPPSFNTDPYQQSTPNWVATRPLIQQGSVKSYPAVLAYHGSNNDRCAYGHPLEWYRFNVTVAEKMKGRFTLNYTISSASPKSVSNGQLVIAISQS